MKLKSILYVLFSLSYILIITSCGNNWLDLEPSTQEEEGKSLQSETDARYRLNGIYSIFRKSNYYGGIYTYYGDVKGDDMQANGDTKRSAKYYFATSTEKSVEDDLWQLPYKVITNANSVINFTNKFDEANMSEGMKDIKGEALALRAIAYFDLVRMFGYPYTKDNGGSLGVPIVLKKQDDLFIKAPRNTVAEVYNQVILPDLQKAILLLSDKRIRGKINKFAASLLLARAYIYMGENDKAYKESVTLIENAENSGYRLWTREEYPTIWSKENTAELFFQIIMVTGESGPGKTGVAYLMSKKGYNDIILTSSFVEFLKTDPDDVRLELVTKDKKYYLNKYSGTDAGLSYPNIPVLRLSEAYLIAAEAAVKKGDNENALKYLNFIVERANPIATVTGVVTLDRVLDEYRKEFVGEGHRFFDAMRNNKTIERIGSSHLSLSNEKRKFDWNKYFVPLPIPIAQITAYDYLMKQNPGYQTISELK